MYNVFIHRRIFMTIGIYALYWQDKGLVYIGQTANIVRRITQHISYLKAGTHENYKVQNAFDKYGMPQHYVLEECTLEDINNCEISWITEFDAINSGLNIIEGGGHSYGVNHTTSKNSKLQIYKAFILLANTDEPFDYIVKRTGVSRSILSHIVNKRVHTWLQEVRPEMYAKATRSRKHLAIKHNAKTRTGKGSKNCLYEFISPEGEKFIADCITVFCRESARFDNIKAAQGGFSRVLHGHRDNYYGWKCSKLLT